MRTDFRNQQQLKVCRRFVSEIRSRSTKLGSRRRELRVFGDRTGYDQISGRRILDESKVWFPCHRTGRDIESIPANALEDAGSCGSCKWHCIRWVELSSEGDETGLVLWKAIRHDGGYTQHWLSDNTLGWMVAQCEENDLLTFDQD